MYPFEETSFDNKHFFRLALNAFSSGKGEISVLERGQYQVVRSIIADSTFKMVCPPDEEPILPYAESRITMARLMADTLWTLLIKRRLLSPRQRLYDDVWLQSVFSRNHQQLTKAPDPLSFEAVMEELHFQDMYQLAEMAKELPSSQAEADLRINIAVLTPYPVPQTVEEAFASDSQRKAADHTLPDFLFRVFSRTFRGEVDWAQMEKVAKEFD